MAVCRNWRFADIRASARNNRAQLFKHLGCHAFRPIVMAPPMNDSMPNCGDSRETNRAFEPIDQQADRNRLIWDLNPTFLGTTAVGLVNDPPGILQPDSIDLTGQSPHGRIGPLEEREFETRRAAVDREDVGVSGFHG